MTADRSKPDLLFVTLIHQSLRIDGDRLLASVTALEPADRSRRLPAIRTFFDQYRDQLRLHHTHEDHLFFPALEAAVGTDQMPLTDMAAQHGMLDVGLQAISRALDLLAGPAGDFEASRAEVANELSYLVSQLAAHLDLEEATMFPLMGSALSRAAYRELEAEARRQTSRPRSRFLIPWLVAHATPQQRAALFKAAPPLRVVDRLNRRRYRRLDRALAL